MKKLTKLPDNCVLVEDFKYFFRLKPRKRKWVKENLELHEGLRYYLKSSIRQDIYYERVVFADEDNEINQHTSYSIRRCISKQMCYMPLEDYNKAIEEYNKAENNED